MGFIITVAIFSFCLGYFLGLLSASDYYDKVINTIKEYLERHDKEE